MYELELLTSPALRQVIRRGIRTVVVPFGSVEHHGGHLPLGTDALLADLIGREVAVRLDAVLVPTVRVGYAEQHMQRNGTLTVGALTLRNVAAEIGESLAAHGFQVIALISAHGGNVGSLRAAVEHLNCALAGVVACAPEGDVGQDPGSHSGRWLTSVMLALRPELVQLDAADPDLAKELQAADPEAGAVHIERFVDSIVADVRRTATDARP